MPRIHNGLVKSKITFQRYFLDPFGYYFTNNFHNTYLSSDYSSLLGGVGLVNLYLEGNLCPDSFTQFLIAETPTLWVLASRVGGFRSSTTSLTIALFSASLKSLALFGLGDFMSSGLLNIV